MGLSDSRRKTHKQSKYLTFMVIPDSTNTKVRQLKVPHWFLYMLSGVAVCAVIVIAGLSTLNSYSRAKLEETAKIIEETNEEKKELIDQKTQIEIQKSRIEQSLNSQQGNFDKQLEVYMSQLIEIEAQLAEIEKQAKENYDKMNVAGSPVSKEIPETFMGGQFSPVFEEGASTGEKLNLLMATLSVECENTRAFMEEYTNDVDEFVDFRDSFPNLKPVSGRITSEFGGRTDPFTGGGANHTGMDIKASTGTRVKATGNGVVTKAEYVSGYGNLVVIKHGYGYETYYAHNSQLLVEAGEKVKAGDTIALSGNTGRSTGPHVHYEVRLYGVAKNPRNYISALD